jgi:hypothetical protein
VETGIPSACSGLHLAASIGGVIAKSPPPVTLVIRRTVAPKTQPLFSASLQSKAESGDRAQA